jgi:hypothetical protein
MPGVLRDSLELPGFAFREEPVGRYKDILEKDVTFALVRHPVARQLPVHVVKCLGVSRRTSSFHCHKALSARSWN